MPYGCNLDILFARKDTVTAMAQEGSAFETAHLKRTPVGEYPAADLEVRVRPARYAKTSAVLTGDRVHPLVEQP
jgi:hypothetical protein